MKGSANFDLEEFKFHFDNLSKDMYEVETETIDESVPRPPKESD